MSWEPRPLPRVDPETERYWSAAADGDLLLRHCTDCDLAYHYPRARCPDCLGDAVEWRAAAGTGTLYSYTETAIVDAWPDEALPMVCGYVELVEGPRVFASFVDCDLEDLSIGMDMAVRFESTADPDIGIPVFAPTE